MEENIVTIDISKILGNAPSQDSQTAKKIEVAAQQVGDAFLLALEAGQKSNPKSRVSRFLLNLSKRLE